MFKSHFKKPIWIRGAVAWTGQEWIQPQLSLQQPKIQTWDEIPQEGLRQKKMMSHSAWLSYLALHRTLLACDWSTEREETACFLGVGASGSDEAELSRIVGASLDSDAKFSISQFGSAGLAACNPLFAFQLMNNFTLCHGSILEKLGGPNAAFYSRGVGTALALAEACFALEENQTHRALAGGADTSLHPVTHLELLRTGKIEGGLKPAEGAAYLALTNEPNELRNTNDFYIEHVSFYGGGRRGDLTQWVDRALFKIQPSASDRVFILPWGRETRAVFKKIFHPRPIQDLSESIGESLAAAPAIAWVEALRRMTQNGDERGIILNAGIDGGLGAVVFSRKTGGDSGN